MPKVSTPVRIPVPGGKQISEHFGLASSGHGSVSVAHMIVPGGWSEDAQTPAFDEVTIMVRGRLSVLVEGEEMVVSAGQTILVEAGSTVRYSSPDDEGCEYWAVCVPAFSVTRAGRE